MKSIDPGQAVTILSNIGMIAGIVFTSAGVADKHTPVD
jgi:hypothetical protein